MAKKQAKDPDVIDLNVSFGSVSFGKKTARVGVTVARDSLTLSRANEYFCDRRLVTTIHANPIGDQPGQGRLDSMEDNVEMDGVADVKGFSVHTSTISFGLTFNAKELKSIAAKTGIQFNDFAAREGRLIISGVGEIPEGEDGEDAEDEGSDE